VTFGYYLLTVFSCSFTTSLAFISFGCYFGTSFVGYFSLRGYYFFGGIMCNLTYIMHI
jgi:hypothetical protein